MGSNHCRPGSRKRSPFPEKLTIMSTPPSANLVLVHPTPLERLVVPAALDAIRQWRYRPYFLNGEPVEVETQVTVNFVLTGG